MYKGDPNTDSPVPPKVAALSTLAGLKKGDLCKITSTYLKKEIPRKAIQRMTFLLINEVKMNVLIQATNNMGFPVQPRASVWLS